MAKDDTGEETSPDVPKDDPVQKDEAAAKKPDRKERSSKKDTPAPKDEGNGPEDKGQGPEGELPVPPPKTWGQWFHSELLDLEKTVAALLVTALVVVAFNGLTGMSKSSSEVMMTDRSTSDYVAEPPPEPTADSNTKGGKEPAPTMEAQGGEGDTADTGPEMTEPDPSLDMTIEGRETDPAPVKVEGAGDFEGAVGASSGGSNTEGSTTESALDRADAAPPAPQEPDADTAPTAPPEPDEERDEPGSIPLAQEKPAAAAPDKASKSSGVSNTLRNMLDIKDIAEIFIIVRAFFLLNVRRLLWKQPASPYPMSYAGAPGYPQQGYGYQQYGAQGGYQSQGQAAMYQGQGYGQQQVYQGQQNTVQQRPYRQY